MEKCGTYGGEKLSCTVLSSGIVFVGKSKVIQIVAEVFVQKAFKYMLVMSAYRGFATSYSGIRATSRPCCEKAVE